MVGTDPAAGTVALGTEVSVAVPDPLVSTGAADGVMLVGTGGDETGSSAGWVVVGGDIKDLP